MSFVSNGEGHYVGVACDECPDPIATFRRTVRLAGMKFEGDKIPEGWVHIVNTETKKHTHYCPEHADAGRSLPEGRG